MKIFFSSLGCDKNLCDAEHMLKLLSDAGYSFTDDASEAEIAIVNSCSFIGDASEESIQEILGLSSFKENGCLKALIVTGCLSERFHEQFREELPEVDGCLGIGSWDRIVQVVREALDKKRPAVFESRDRLPGTNGRILTNGGYSGYLKIAEGCDKYCSYCIIPYIRGRFRSVPMDELLKEAGELAEKGIKELILVAQETTLYGTDLYGKKMLPELLQKLSGIPGIEWLRLLYCYPEEITDELIAALRDNPKVVPYIDMPVQHASDTILRKMGRRTTREDICAVIRKLREEIPGITLRTTLMTGFPGETEADFETLLEFVDEAEFDRLGVFAYSREEGTAAADFSDQVPEELKQERRNAVMELQQTIAAEKNREKIGTEVDVIIEGYLVSEDVYQGRTAGDAPDVDGYIFLRSDRELMSGEIVRATVTAAEVYDLIGELKE